MAEILSPGVFIEEVPSSQNVVQPVSTSNLGAVGFTPRGPTDKATLVTSYEQFSRIFGPDTKMSLLPKSIAAFYANGGRRAFVVRVVPNDAVAANAQVQSAVLGQVAETSTGAGSYSKTSQTTSLPANDGASTLVPGEFSFRWRGASAAPVTDTAVARDGQTLLIADTGYYGAMTHIAGRLPPYAGTMVGTVTAGVPNSTTVIYRAVQMGSAGQNIQVAHYARDDVFPTTTHSITTAGGVTQILIQPATSASGIVDTSVHSSTIAAYVSSHSELSALITATAGGDGSGTVQAQTDMMSLVYAPLLGIPDIEDPLEVVAHSDVTIAWTHGTSKSLVFLGTAAGPVVTATSAGVASGTFDRRTGFFSIQIIGDNAPSTGSAVLFTCIYATPNKTAVAGSTVNADGSVALTGDCTTGTYTVPGSLSSYVNVVDGSYKVTLASAAAFATGTQMLADYTYNAWAVNPVSKGVWGSDLRLDVRGNPDYYSPVYVPAAGTTPAKLAQTYTKFDANLMMADSLGNYSVVESYEELDFVDPTSATYFPDVLNELSDLITVTEPGSDMAPAELAGVAHVVAIGGGNATSGNRAFAGTLPSQNVGKRSVVIAYTSSVDGLVKTITDDGAKNLTGAVDMSQSHTIDYSTGAYTFSTSDLIQAGTLVLASYATAPAETTHREFFGDTNKDYSFSVTYPQAKDYAFYAAGSDGSFDSTHFSRNEFTEPTALKPANKGLYALSRVDELMQVIVPDFAGEVVVTGDLLDYAAERASQPSGGDRFIILTTPKGCDPQEAVDWFRFQLNRTSKYAALYWPWVNVSDPLSNGRNLAMPALGHVAGIYARTDTNRNVGKAPGGTVDGALQYLTGLEYVSTQAERDYVYPNKINPLVSGAQTGLAVWGVRTIAAESEWKYINARRLFMFLEKSVFNSTHWIVFENNGPALWSRIKAQVNGFLSSLFAEGYFAGSSPSKAFYVTVDDSNNPQASIDLGQVIIDIGVAPNKPAEFVRFRFQQKSLD